MIESSLRTEHPMITIRPDNRPQPSLLTPKDLGFNYLAWRVGQQLALLMIMTGTQHVAIEAPTGSGKSVIAAALSRLEPQYRHVILTSTKLLQDQYTREFPHLVDFRGGQNYHCVAAEDLFKDWFAPNRRRYARCDAGPCHVGERCFYKEDGCPYYMARRRFIGAPAAITNYSAWLGNRKAGDRLGGAHRVICDEAHDLPEQLMKASSVELPARLFTARRPTTVKSWQDWASRQLDHLKQGQTRSVKTEPLARGLQLIVEKMDETWAWQLEKNDATKLEPTIPRLLMPSLQSFDDPNVALAQVVYLSATITPSMFDVLGVPANQVTFHQVPSQFTPASRPIYFVPGSRYNWNTRNDPNERQKLIDAIDRIIETRLDRNGLIHSQSFELTRLICAGSRYADRFIVQRDGQPVDDACQRFKHAPLGTVLISPSIRTGVDFPDNEARYQIIPKMPFPPAKDAIMQARCANTAGYKAHYVMQQFVQACGRIVRSQDDWGETFVTDDVGWYFWQDHRHLVPTWFREAVRQTRRVISPMALEGVER